MTQSSFPLFPRLCYSLSLSLFLHPFPSSLARVWHTAVGVCGANMKSKIPLKREEKPYCFGLSLMSESPVASNENNKAGNMLLI